VNPVIPGFAGALFLSKTAMDRSYNLAWESPWPILLGLLSSLNYQT